MAYLVEADLHRRIFAENLAEIKRDNTTVVSEAIEAAIAFVQSYLSRFDLLALFGDDDTAPTVTDKNLKSKVIDVACYELVKLNNPGLNAEEYRMYYEDAEAWLKAVQKGGADPNGWPLKEANTDTGTSPGQLATWSSVPKRNDEY